MLRDRAGRGYWASEQALYKGIAVNAPVRRRPNGTLLPGFTANAGGRPRSVTDALKEKYRNRLPELMDRLFFLTGPNNPPMVQIAAIRELLDRLLGKPQVTIEANTARLDISSMYLAALKRANAEMQSVNSHIASEQVVEGKANAGNSINGGSVGAASE